MLLGTPSMLHATDHGADTLLAGGVTEPWAQTLRIPWVGGEYEPLVPKRVSVVSHFCALLLRLPRKKRMKDWIITG